MADRNPYRPWIILLSGALLIAAAVGLTFLWPRGADQTAGKAPPAPAAAPPAAPLKEVAPSFDVVRISPEGDTVIAGRATPGAEVTILDGGKAIGKVTADARGEWVFLPPEPLPPGSRTLSLESRLSGAKAVLSDSVLVLVVPERGKDIAGRPASGATPLAIRVPRGGGSGTTVLLVPGGGAGGGLGLTAIDYDQAGHIGFDGHADPGATLRVYLDDKAVGDAVAGSDGQWHLALQSKSPLGQYTVRVDQIGADGKVIARVMTPVQLIADAPLQEGAVTVRAGNSLWRIARKIYGKGTLYAVIFTANQGHIKDPNLIYPGQTFTLPQARRAETPAPPPGQ